MVVSIFPPRRSDVPPFDTPLLQRRGPFQGLEEPELTKVLSGELLFLVKNKGSVCPRIVQVGRLFRLELLGT